MLPAWTLEDRALRIATPTDFSFEQNVSYLSRSSNECLYRIDAQRIYRALPLQGETTVVEISAEPSGSLRVRFLGDGSPKSQAVYDEAARYICDWFDLHTNLEPFYALAQTDPLLDQPVRQFRGLRLIGIPDLFEALCWGIIGQQIHLSFAYTLKRRLVERYGRNVVCDGQTYWVFPEPEAIAALTVEAMDGLQLTVRKREYLIGVARLMAEGTLTRERLLQAGSPKAIEAMLTRIRGIGPWTANYVLMRCLRIPSAFPIDDVGLQLAIQHLLKLPAKPAKAHIRQLAAGWTGWESYATFYLWRCLY